MPARQYPTRISFWLIMAALLLPLWGGAMPGHAQAQPLTVQRLVRQEVPIYDDNLDDARKRAVHYGQGRALDTLVRELVHETWSEELKRELRRHVFSRQQRYISLFRIRNQGTSPDRTRYQVALAVELNQAQLMEDLRTLDIPLLEDKPVKIGVFYAGSDPMLGNSRLRGWLEAPLRDRMDLLKRTPRAAVGLNDDKAQGFAEDMPEARGKLIAATGSEEALWLEMRPLPAVEGETPLPPGWRLRMRHFYRGGQEMGGPLEITYRDKAFSGTAADQGPLARLFVKHMVEPFLVQVRPGNFRTGAFQAAEATRLRLRVLGLQTVEAQDAFEQAFFARGTPFARFGLHALGAHSVTYSGIYSGDHDALERTLRGKTYGEFRIRSVYYVEDLLEIDVRRTIRAHHQEMRRFPREARDPSLAQLLNDTFADYSRYDVEEPLFTEVEDNGWTIRANTVPLEATFYGFLDSRSDSDYYVAEALAAGDKIVFHWYRFGQSNLTPAVRLYDESGALVSEFHPRTWMRYEYTVPKGQHSLYLEVADRFGYLKVDTGGYLNFHYLMRLQRNPPEKK